MDYDPLANTDATIMHLKEEVGRLETRVSELEARNRPNVVSQATSFCQREEFCSANAVSICPVIVSKLAVSSELSNTCV